MKRAGNAYARLWMIGLTVLVLGFFTGSQAFSKQSINTEKTNAFENGIHPTGLPALTPKELKWQNRHLLRVRTVRMNRLGLRRINRHRMRHGRRKWTQKDLTVVPTGKEIVGAISGSQTTVSPQTQTTTTSTVSTVPASSLPDAVDNSTLKYFPPIRSQGSLNSCGAFSGTYYAMTYMYAMANDIDAKNGGTACQLSPKWTYNMLNGGGNNGVWYYWAYDIGIKNGVATWAEFPYDSNYRAWCLNPAVWKAAIYRRFDKEGYVANTDQDSGIQEVKQLLVNGYVLNIPTYIYSWQYTTISDDPSTNADDAYVGKKVCYWVNGTSGYHAMTVVGYNDNIWVDINKNGKVDPGEKGAFRIANSWGTGWGEGGYVWMAYDALKNPSAVSGGPSTGRIDGWTPARAYWVTAKSAYQPTLLAEFTLNEAQRNQLQMTLGVADPTQSTPSQTWVPDMIYGQGGPYAFDGTTTACDATFVFDFSDIVPSGDLQRYFLGVKDTVSGSPVTVKDFHLIDLSADNTEKACTATPLSGDNQQLYASVDYAVGGTNAIPVAQAQATPVSGVAPLTVSFDASGSYDPDGTIASYSWDFGDGGGGSGVTVSHTYISAGTYDATLTVTDNKGATNEYWLTISVSPDPSKVLLVKAIQMSLQSVSQTRNAKAIVSIDNLNYTPVANATVTGQWSGLVSGQATGLTDANGNVSFLSPDVPASSGTVTFSITNVSAPAYTYDSSLNTVTQNSISVTQLVNQAPVARITADQTEGTAPLAVQFDGSGSSDPDGSIVSYQWNFGNGLTAKGPAASTTYDTPGTYDATLTVTDNSGATNTATMVITVSSSTPQPSVYVYNLGIGIVPARHWAGVAVTVELRDTDGNPVPDASVSGSWSGVVNGKSSGTTDANGMLTLSERNIKKTGAVQFTVDSVSAAGLTYAPNLNKETTVSIDVN